MTAASGYRPLGTTPARLPVLAVVATLSVFTARSAVGHAVRIGTDPAVDAGSTQARHG